LPNLFWRFYFDAASAEQSKSNLKDESARPFPTIGGDFKKERKK